MKPTSLNTLRLAATNLGPVTAQWDKWLVKHGKETARKPDGFWHPSALAGCPTAAFYQQMGFPEMCSPLSTQILRIFDVGHALHAVMQHQMYLAGMIHTIDGKPAVEVGFQLDDVRMKGSIDAIFVINGKRRVGELKTKNSNSLAKLIDPEPAHLFQATCYQIAAERLKIVDTDLVTYIYYGKNDSFIKEFERQVSPALKNQINDKLTLLNSWQLEYNVKGTIPAPHYKEANKAPCRECKWQNVCHSTITRTEWLGKIERAQNADHQEVPPVAAQPQAEPAAPRRPVPPIRRK